MTSSGDESDLADADVQQELLKQLDKYGESLLDRKNDKQKGLKKRKAAADPASGKLPEEKKAKKRKKKKKKAEDELDSLDSSGESEDEDDRAGAISSKQRHLEELKSTLGLTAMEISRLKQQASREDAKSASNVNTTVKAVPRKRPPPEVIVFEDPARRKKKGNAVHRPAVQRASAHEDEDARPEFNLHKARHDVQRFGIKGFDKVAKDEAQTALMVKLGAKPPKRPYVNYRELQEMKRKSKETDSEQASYEKLMGYMASKKGTSKQRKGKNELKGLDGQVGSYRAGVQFLRHDDITKIKQSSNKNRKGRR